MSLKILLLFVAIFIIEFIASCIYSFYKLYVSDYHDRLFHSTLDKPKNWPYSKGKLLWYIWISIFVMFVCAVVLICLIIKFNGVWGVNPWIIGLFTAFIYGVLVLIGYCHGGLECVIRIGILKDDFNLEGYSISYGMSMIHF